MQFENIQAEVPELPKPRFSKKKKADAIATPPPTLVEPDVSVQKPKRTHKKVVPEASNQEPKKKIKEDNVPVVPVQQEPTTEKLKRKRRTKAELEASRAEAGPNEKKGRGRPRKNVDPDEPPKEKQKRGRKPLAEPMQINTTGSAKYNQLYYNEKRINIARRRLIKKLENGEHVSSKMLIKYGLASTE